MPPLRLARHLVSGSKRRTQTDTHDLDLTYITPRIIALGLPASGLERLYRNPLETVRDYLDQRHGGKYAMVNLCDERDYPNEDWPMAARIFRFPFADHHTCCLSALHTFCEQTATFLAADPDHVIAVHCKAGKGRTGVMIAAYLLFEGVHTDAEQAMHFFRTTRTTDLDAVNNPSQCTYVNMYSKLLATATPERPRLLTGPTITLHAITISAAPAALSGFIPAPPAVHSAPAASAAEPPATAAVSADEAAATGAPAQVVDAAAAAAAPPPPPPPSVPVDIVRDVAGSGAGGVSALASLVVPSWHLKIALYSLRPIDTADGVRSVRSHVSTVGPTKCAPLQPRVRFELPSGGLRARGDLQLSLLSAAGLVASDDELGWTHVHTSWMVDGSAPAAAPPDAPTHHRTFRVGRGDVDKVSKDGRFAADWSITLHFSTEADDEEVEPPPNLS